MFGIHLVAVGVAIGLVVAGKHFTALKKPGRIKRPTTRQEQIKMFEESGMFECFHVVPYSFESHPLVKALVEEGFFSFEDVRNRLMLPIAKELAEKLRLPIYTATPIKSYRLGLLGKLDEYWEGAAAGNAKPDLYKLAERFEYLVDAMRVGIINGDLSPSAGSVEETEANSLQPPQVSSTSLGEAADDRSSLDVLVFLSRSLADIASLETTLRSLSEQFTPLGGPYSEIERAWKMQRDGLDFSIALMNGPAPLDRDDSIVKSKWYATDNWRDLRTHTAHLVIIVKGSVAVEKLVEVMEHVVGVLAQSDCPVVAASIPDAHSSQRRIASLDAIKKLTATSSAWPDVGTLESRAVSTLH